MYLALEISTVAFPEGVLGYRALKIRIKAKKNYEHFYILSYSLALPSPPAPGVELRKPQVQDAFQLGKSKESRIEQAWRTKIKPQQAHQNLPRFEQFYLT